MVHDQYLVLTCLFCGPIMSLKPTALIFVLAQIAFLAFGSLELRGQTDNKPAPDKSVVYKTIGDVELKLDVFLPVDHDPSSEAPAVVFFFGGGWNTGSTAQFYEQSKLLNQYGVVTFCADYRVRSRHRTSPFECVKDGKSAIRWVRENAKELGVNPGQIVASGGSAGGHVAVCTGLIEGLDEAGEATTVSSVPNAMVLFNPVLDTTDKGFGEQRFEEKDRTTISPCHQIREDIVPTLLFHGTGDKTVPFENAERFTRLMKEADNRCELVSFAGAGHGFFNGKLFRPKLEDDKHFQATMKSFVEFLQSLEYIPAPAEDSQASSFRKPNIIVIYTDDQGYGDVSALNPDSKFQTPNMDQIALEGVSFTNGHSADSICTPSRYALLTGRYPWRTQMKRSVLGAEAKCLISDGRMTLASMLKSRGYHTAMVGKWHLGMDFPGKPGSRDWSQPVLDMPLDKGFDYYYGIPASLNYGILAWFEGRHAEVPPTQFSNKKPNARHSDYRIMPPYDQTPEETAEKLNRRGFEIASDFVDNQCLTRFTDKALAWMETKVADAKAGKPFFLYLPYTSPHFPVCPLPEFHGQGDCGAYGEFLIETDYHIGRVLRFLKEQGIDDDTLVVFTSDNGPERPWKEHLEEFGHDSRGGFREGKRSVYEGGHRVPFLIRWPNGIESPGRSWAAPVGQVDLLATFAEIVDVKLPADAGEDSQSFASVLLDKDADHQRVPLIALGNYGGDTRYSIIDGQWKLILPSKTTDRTELYDLAQDKAEKKNLQEQHSQRVTTLTNQLNQIIVSGRSTPGPPQSNDTGHWRDLTWLTETQYNELRQQHADQ